MRALRKHHRTLSYLGALPLRDRYVDLEQSTDLKSHRTQSVSSQLHFGSTSQTMDLTRNAASANHCALAAAPTSSAAQASLVRSTSDYYSPATLVSLKSQAAKTTWCKSALSHLAMGHMACEVQPSSFIRAWRIEPKSLRTTLLDYVKFS